MSRNWKGKHVELEIDSLTHEGKGRGFLAPERPVDVPFTAVGDKVEARLLRRNKGTIQTQLVQVLEEGPGRVPSKCVHFGECGGCKWQHIPYEEQLKIKQSWVEELFPGVECSEIVACDPPWNYRNKMEFSFSQDRAGSRYLGLMRQYGRVEDLSECHLCDPWMLEVLSCVRKWWEASGLEAYNFHKDLGALRTLMCRAGQRTGEKMVMLTVSGNPDFALSQEQIQSFKEAMSFVDSVFLRIQQIKKGSPTQFYEMHLKGPEHVEEKLTVSGKEMRFKISPIAFFQPNSRQAEKLYALALSMAGLSGKETVWDLYCGTGTLGLSAASKAAHVVGVEIVPDAVYDARENAILNSVENAEFIKGDVGKMVRDLVRSGKPRPDVCLIDPPRVGLDELAIESVALLGAQKIVYVSCNPKTQAENVRQLEGLGYQLKALQPVDQFPHTVHIENIALLEKVSDL
jgi:23S rRNA (uracil1939-C5)-methyltransferase